MIFFQNNNSCLYQLLIGMGFFLYSNVMVKRNFIYLNHCLFKLFYIAVVGLVSSMLMII